MFTQTATISCTRGEMLQMLLSWKNSESSCSCPSNKETFQQAFDVDFTSHCCCISMLRGSSKVIKICIFPYLKTTTTTKKKGLNILNNLHSQWIMIYDIPHFVLFIIWLLKSRHAAALVIFTAHGKADFSVIKILHFLLACSFLSTILLFIRLHNKSVYNNSNFLVAFFIPLTVRKPI